MNTNALRQKILDLAIHGKLVKQDPADESATILLEKIRAEKEKKIASGELKRGKNDSYIFFGDDNRHYEKFADGRVKDIEDEIPFAVPEGWVWASLSEIANIYTGNSINENEKNKKYSNVSNGLFYIATKDIDFEGVINYENGIKIPFSESKFKIAPAQSSLICIEGGSAGRKIGFINKEVCFVNKLCCLHCEFIDNLYLFYYLRSSTFIDFFNVNKSGLIGGVSLNLLKRIPLPLPPLAEQKCIVTIIETIFAQIDLLEQNKADLQTAVKQAKSKILDLAIRGKLVPQDPADEPAFVMLEKLRAEKEAKIAAGEIKRGKNDSYIYKNSTDNCYYEKFGDGTEKATEMLSAIPESWTWSHFGDVADVINGKNQSQVEDDTGEYPIYGSGGIMGYANDYICPENCTIIGRKGSINNPIFVEEKFWNVDTAFGLAPSSIILPRYLFYFCKSFDFTSLDSSTTLPSLTKTSIQRILFPLPPLAAQKRILDKIDELFSQLDKISLNII